MGGKNVKELEQKVAQIFNKEFGLMTNSGSSSYGFYALFNGRNN